MVRTVLDQGHLCPLPLAVRPIYWSHDHALRIYPSPQAVSMIPFVTDKKVFIIPLRIARPG